MTNTEQRNVVLVTMDSLRADHCSYWGYDRPTTPTLDRMAREGLAFTNAISPGPSTPESMPVILTGEYPVVTDARLRSELARRRTAIRRHMQVRFTLAERFSCAGYATAGFSPNPYTSRYFGFGSGFDHYEDFLSGSRERLYQGMFDGVLNNVSKSSVLPARVLLNWVQREEVFKPWEAFYDNIVEWTHDVEEPYFLWVLLMDTHDPYLVPPEYRTQSQWAMYRANYQLWRQGHEPPVSDRTHERLVRAYDDSIRYADTFLARLHEDLSGDDPLVAVHGDHGEAFGEHKTYGHHPVLYEENVHVPLVISGGPTETVEEPISLRRLPNLIESLAVEESTPQVEGPAVAQTLEEDRLAARGRQWKYIRNGDGAGKLYALSTDPDERTPINDADLRQAAREIADCSVEAHRELERIGAAVRAVSEGPL